MLIRPQHPATFDPLASEIFIPKLLLRLPGITQHGMGWLPCCCCPCQGCSDGYPEELTGTLAVTGDTEVGTCCTGLNGNYTMTAVPGAFPASSGHGCAWNWIYPGADNCASKCGLRALGFQIACIEEYDDIMGHHPATLGITAVVTARDDSGFGWGIMLTFSKSFVPVVPLDCKNFVALDIPPLSANSWVCDATHKCTNPVATFSVTS